MIVVSFYTDSRYRALSDRLAKSVSAIGLTSDIREVHDHGSWLANVRAKPLFCYLMVRKYGEVLWVDADAVLVSPPALLLGKPRFDFGAFFSTCDNAWSGVLYFSGSAASLVLIKAWISALPKFPNEDDEIPLKSVLAKTSQWRTGHLPPSYNWNERRLRHRFPGTVPIIQHSMVTSNQEVL